MTPPTHMGQEEQEGIFFLFSSFVFKTLQLLTNTILHEIQFRKVPMIKIAEGNQANVFKTVWNWIKGVKKKPILGHKFQH